MSEKTLSPTHYRLLTTFKAVGPYLREPLSQEGFYLFDCLSVCVDEKKSPEKREFWGWWMEFNQQGEGFEARFHLGLYNQAGEWVAEEVPAQAHEEVLKTLSVFDQKLTKALEEKHQLGYSLHPDSVPVEH